jgi:Ca2+-transporting ATPase
MPSSRNRTPTKTAPLHPFTKIVWYSLTAEETLDKLDVQSNRGLSVDEAEARLTEFGPNQLTETRGVSAWELLFDQFKNTLIIILLIAVGLSAVMGHHIEAIAIGVIVLFAVLLGFVQEYRAGRAIEALRKMAAPTATVLRGGEELEIPAQMLVPGDIILLAAGNRVPADARVLESMSLHAEEAPLTGESVPVEKRPDALQGDNLPVGDRRNIVHAGTVITYGRGRAVVVATGMQTEFGKIAGMLQTVETTETPLQKNLDRVGKSLAKAALVVVLIISVIGLVRGQPLLDIVIFGIALAVAVVPEALPAVVTISLAIGVQRMVKRHALIRSLPAVETLGSTSVICSDKTGTLTKDEMTARKIYAGGQMFDVGGNGYEPHGEFSVGGKTMEPSSALMDLLIAGALCADTSLVHTEDGWDVKGDPTEGALVVAAAKAGLRKEALDDQSPRTAEIPFTSETKRMTTLHRSGKNEIAYAKGAPEVLLEACKTERAAAGEVPLTPERRKEILDAAKAMADDSLRVLAVASKADTTLAESEREMTFLGLVGMIDPPRPEAKSAVAKCKLAGIKTIMITGDHPMTAMAIARELGILDKGRAVTGAELDDISEEDFVKSVETIEVYARVSPAHKLRVVTALQKNGHIVAMTGDGVNDAPALKKADIGIAMGITGTDVTKEAAAMTLTDDNFASIVAAVEEGRGIFGNIKKYLMYLLSANIGEIGLMTAASALGLPLPLTAVQILYVNLATDGLPALALAVDPPERDLMRRPPSNAKAGIFNRATISLMLTGGIWSMIVNLTLFWWAIESGRSLPEAMTMTFISLVLIEFSKAYAFRSDRNSVLHRPFSNKWLNLSVLWELGLLMLIIYVPFLQHPFETVSMPKEDWLLIGAAALTILPVLEIAKFFVRRSHIAT